MKKFVSEMSKFFGKKPGESLADFSNEMKELTNDDRRDLAQMLADHLGESVQVSINGAPEEYQPA